MAPVNHDSEKNIRIISVPEFLYFVIGILSIVKAAR